MESLSLGVKLPGLTVTVMVSPACGVKLFTVIDGALAGTKLAETVPPRAAANAKAAINNQAAKAKAVVLVILH
jgi:hypothetical protein